jgi:O-antigen/teichoic acid export membrane protein
LRLTEVSQKEPLSIGAAFARGVLTTSISQVAVIVLSVVTAITQARMLGTEGRGDVARFVNMGALVVLYFGLGIASALTYFMASGQVPRDALTRVLRPVFVLTVLGVVVFIAVLARTPLESLLPQSLPIAWVIALFGVFFALSQGNSWIAASHAARTSGSTSTHGTIRASSSTASPPTKVPPHLASRIAT